MEDIFYTVQKRDSTCIHATLVYTLTEEECKIRILLKEDRAICDSIYRRINRIPSYVFLMSRKSVPVESMIQKICWDEGMGMNFPVEIPVSKSLQNCLRNTIEFFKQEEFVLSGTWEDDNVLLE
jgi:hypothetical protein